MGSAILLHLGPAGPRGPPAGRNLLSLGCQPQDQTASLSPGAPQGRHPGGARIRPSGERSPTQKSHGGSLPHEISPFVSLDGAPVSLGRAPRRDLPKTSRGGALPSEMFPDGLGGEISPSERYAKNLVGGASPARFFRRDSNKVRGLALPSPHPACPERALAQRRGPDRLYRGRGSAQSSRPCSPSFAVKYRRLPASVSWSGFEGAGPGRMSWTRVVPAAVPSLCQSS